MITFAGQVTISSEDAHVLGSELCYKLDLFRRIHTNATVRCLSTLPCLNPSHNGDDKELTANVSVWGVYLVKMHAPPSTMLQSQEK